MKLLYDLEQTDSEPISITNVPYNPCSFNSPKPSTTSNSYMYSAPSASSPLNTTINELQVPSSLRNDLHDHEVQRNTSFFFDLYSNKEQMKHVRDEYNFQTLRPMEISRLFSNISEQSLPNAVMNLANISHSSGGLLETSTQDRVLARSTQMVDPQCLYQGYMMRTASESHVAPPQMRRSPSTSYLPVNTYASESLPQSTELSPDTSQLNSSTAARSRRLTRPVPQTNTVIGVLLQRLYLMRKAPAEDSSEPKLQRKGDAIAFAIDQMTMTELLHLLRNLMWLQTSTSDETKATWDAPIPEVNVEASGDLSSLSKLLASKDLAEITEALKTVSGIRDEEFLQSIARWCQDQSYTRDPQASGGNAASPNDSFRRNACSNTDSFQAPFESLRHSRIQQTTSPLNNPRDGVRPASYSFGSSMPEFNSIKELLRSLVSKVQLLHSAVLAQAEIQTQTLAAIVENKSRCCHVPRSASNIIDQDIQACGNSARRKRQRLHSSDGAHISNTLNVEETKTLLKDDATSESKQNTHLLTDVPKAVVTERVTSLGTSSAHPSPLAEATNQQSTPADLPSSVEDESLSRCMSQIEALAFATPHWALNQNSFEWHKQRLIEKTDKISDDASSSLNGRAQEYLDLFLSDISFAESSTSDTSPNVCFNNLISKEAIAFLSPYDSDGTLKDAWDITSYGLCGFSHRGHECGDAAEQRNSCPSTKEQTSNSLEQATLRLRQAAELIPLWTARLDNLRAKHDSHFIPIIALPTFLQSSTFFQFMLNYVPIARGHLKTGLQRVLSDFERSQVPLEKSEEELVPVASADWMMKPPESSSTFTKLSPLNSRRQPAIMYLSPTSVPSLVYESKGNGGTDCQSRQDRQIKVEFNDSYLHSNHGFVSPVVGSEPLSHIPTENLPHPSPQQTSSSSTQLEGFSQESSSYSNATLVSADDELTQSTNFDQALDNIHVQKSSSSQHVSEFSSGFDMSQTNSNVQNARQHSGTGLNPSSQKCNNEDHSGQNSPCSGRKMMVMVYTPKPAAASGSFLSRDEEEESSNNAEDETWVQSNTEISKESQQVAPNSRQQSALMAAIAELTLAKTLAITKTSTSLESPQDGCRTPTTESNFNSSSSIAVPSTSATPQPNKFNCESADTPDAPTTRSGRSGRSGVQGVVWNCEENAWVAFWQDPTTSQQQVRTFPVSQFGADGARKLAMKCRREADKQLTAAVRLNLVAGTAVTGKDTELGPAPRSEVPGVYWYRNRNGWVAQWFENGKNKHKFFAASVFGVEGAKQKAIAYRLLKLEEKRLKGW